MTKSCQNIILITKTSKTQVTVNGTLVHSKLATMAFPDYEATAQVEY